MNVTTRSMARLAQQAHSVEQPAEQQTSQPQEQQLTQPQLQRPAHVPLYQLSTQASPNPQRPTIEELRKSAKFLLNRYYNLTGEKLIPETIPKMGWGSSNKRGFFLGMIDHGFHKDLFELHYYLSNRNEFMCQKNFSQLFQLADTNHIPTFIDRMYDFYIQPFYKGSKSKTRTERVAQDEDTTTASQKNFRESLQKRDEVCLFCWYLTELQGAHIIARKCTAIAGNQNDALDRAGMTDINDIQNGLYLCDNCHNNFDVLKRYVDVVDSASGRVAQPMDDEWLGRLREVISEDQMNNQVWVYKNGELQRVSTNEDTPLCNDVGAVDAHPQDGALQTTLFNLEDALRFDPQDGVTDFNSVDEYAGKKLVVKVMDFSVQKGDKKSIESRLALKNIKNKRVESREEVLLCKNRTVEEPNIGLALHFIDNDPVKLPKLAALIYHKAACLLMRMAGGAEPIDYDCMDDDDLIMYFVEDHIEVPEKKINPESIDRVETWLKTVDSPKKHVQEPAKQQEIVVRQDSGSSVNGNDDVQRTFISHMDRSSLSLMSQKES